MGLNSAARRRAMAVLSRPNPRERVRCQVTGCREIVLMATILDLPEFERLEVDLCPFHHDQLEDAIDAALDRYLSWD